MASRNAVQLRSVPVSPQDKKPEKTISVSHFREMLFVLFFTNALSLILGAFLASAILNGTSDTMTKQVFQTTVAKVLLDKTVDSHK